MSCRTARPMGKAGGRSTGLPNVNKVSREWSMDPERSRLNEIPALISPGRRTVPYRSRRNDNETISEQINIQLNIGYIVTFPLLGGVKKEGKYS